jgi:decaprenylphospho-beta-D-erythro-pentofuranosid-2-ulose 2-reductase
MTMAQAAAADPQRVAIFGATSGIATAVARQLAEGGARLVLIGRDPTGLEATAADIRVRGAAEVATVRADFADAAALPGAADAAWRAFGGLDLAFVAYGSLPDQAAAASDVRLAEEALRLNFVSPCLLCDLLAARFERQASGGAIAVVTSVAGNRGRRSNYLYGAAKGGLQRYLEGLRHRLFAAGVRVLDVRPGFVRTRMTAHLAGGGPLWASPDRVARDILRVVRKRGRRGGPAVLYTPWFWRAVMAGVRGLPAPLFHRTSL